MSAVGGSFLIPNVTSIPSKDDRTERPASLPKGERGDSFREILSEQVRAPLKFSAHATERMNQRSIPMDSSTMLKINEAMDKAASKGLDDTLILTGDAAFIVSVKNRTVVTALDRNSLNGNVFTNIDGAIVV